MIIVHILGSAPGVGADDSCPCLGPALAVGCADDHRAGGGGWRSSCPCVGAGGAVGGADGHRAGGGGVLTIIVPVSRPGAWRGVLMNKALTEELR